MPKKSKRSKKADSSTQRKISETPKHRRAKTPFSKYPAVYDIMAARQECKERGVPSRVALAWMLGGRVQIILDKKSLKKANNRPSRDSVFRRWISESDLCVPENHNTSEPPAEVRSRHRYARCVATSHGESWHAWKEGEVSRFLINPPRTPPNRRWCIIPQEYTIFDPDKDPGVWLAQDETTIAERCIDFGKGVLLEAARVYCLATELIEDFELTFNSLDDPTFPWNRAAKPAQLLQDCKNAAVLMIDSIAYQGALKRNPDAATAVRQGFLMGLRVTQAEAIVSNIASTTSAAQLGTGRPQSKFWEWVNSDPRFAGKAAKEVWSLLHGHDDPDQPGRKIEVREHSLIRFTTPPLKFTSFLSRFKKQPK